MNTYKRRQHNILSFLQKKIILKMLKETTARNLTLTSPPLYYNGLLVDHSVQYFPHSNRDV